MSLRPRLISALIIASFFAVPVVAGPPKPEVVADPVVAIAYEKAGQWDKALDAYLKLYLSDPSLHGDLREKIRECLRHTAQLRRHRDPAFQQYVLSLPLADALNVYAEAVQQLGTRYADKDRATPQRLFILGADELDRAFGEKAFREAFLAGVSESKIAKFLVEL